MRARCVLAAAMVLGCVFAGGTLSVAQSANATLRGQVLDPSGRLVPRAHVQIVSAQSGVTIFDGTADPAGAFVVPQVPPGVYKVTVTSPGLKQFVLENVLATVAKVSSVEVNLEVGSSSEAVTVESKGELLDRSTSGLSTLISPTDVENLPLQQRQTENLLAFIPGVSHGGPGDQPSTIQLSINGSRTLNTEVLLNGISTITAPNGTPVVLPSPDGVDSFRVLTTNAPAEYGRTSGAVITVNTTSGTNAYHGRVYFLIRNEALDANQFFHKDTFDLTTGAVLPRNRDRFFQEGGALGGPVRIPYRANGQERTFFFANVDRTAQPNSTTVTATVPTAAQRGGDLSGSLAAKSATGAPAPVIVYQPNGLGSAAFANNRVGPIDPAAARILALLPLPNTVGTYDPVNNRYTGNYASQQNLTGETWKIVGRLDESISPQDRASLSLYRYKTSTPLPVTFNALLNTTYDCNCSSAWLPSADYTRTWTSSLVTDLNLGFFRNVLARNPPGTGQNASATLGIASLPLDQTPQITSPGLSNIGADANTTQANVTNTYNPFATATKALGAHILKAGFSLRKNEFNSYNPATNPAGLIQFDGSITNRGSPGNPTTGLADFLLGRIKTASYEQPQPETGRRNWNLAFFVQDDWRATPRLTINIGMRYEYESPMKIANNLYSRVDPNTGRLLLAGSNASASLEVTTPKADLSPRLGFAFSLDRRTVIRGGFGTFYGTIFQNLGGQLAFPGYDNTVSYNNLGTGLAQPFSLSQGLPLATPLNPANAAATLSAYTAANPYTVGISFNDLSHIPLIQQWNLGFERQLPLLFALEVNYVGNHGLHLPYVTGENQVPLAMVPAVTLANTALATQNALQFPNLRPFTVISNLGGSSYNALQVTLRRQVSTRLALLSNYTYGKAEDDASSIYSFSAPNGTANSQYPTANGDRLKDYGVSSIDVKHTLNVALVYTTPGPWWLRNFHLSPVLLGRTGLPLNITQTNEIPGAAQRPNGNAKALKLATPYLTGSQLQYFVPASDPAFPLTPSGPVYNTLGGVRTQIVSTGFGNVSRNSNRAPGSVDLDVSLSKDFRVLAGLNVQFRLDAFNVINHTNFQAPATALAVTAVGTQATFATSTTFGKISATYPNRSMQASARFFF